MKTNIERRAFEGLEVRDSASGSGFIGTLTGYAAKFNSNSVDMGGWIERIAPGAFKRSLSEQPDVLALWSHDTNQPIARSPDTLRLSEDDTGLRFEMDLVDTSTNRDLLANVRAKIVRGVSFGFSAQSVRWDAPAKEGDPDLRTLHDVDLYEVSPTVWPAYPETEVGERDHKKFLETRKGSPSLRSVAFKHGEPEASEIPESEQNARGYWEARLRSL